LALSETEDPDLGQKHSSKFTSRAGGVVQVVEFKKKKIFSQNSPPGWEPISPCLSGFVQTTPVDVEVTTEKGLPTHPSYGPGGEGRK
jgi:hypothetical protein